MTRAQTTLTELARLGFAELGETGERLGLLDAPELVPHFASAADPDQALRLLVSLREHAPVEVDAVLGDEDAAGRLIRVLGASTGLAEFFARHPGELECLREPLGAPLPPEDYVRDLVAAV